jgi:hypothetical protein
MGTLLAILEAIKSFFGGLQLLDKWFTKSQAQTAEEIQAKVDEEERRTAHGEPPSGDF